MRRKNKKKANVDIFLKGAPKEIFNATGPGEKRKKVRFGRESCCSSRALGTGSPSAG